jgi:hypothetical protein
MRHYFGDLWEEFGRRGCHVECTRLGLRVSEWRMEVHATSARDVHAKHASKTRMMQFLSNSALFKWVDMRVHMGAHEGDWHWRETRPSLALWATSR